MGLLQTFPERKERAKMMNIFNTSFNDESRLDKVRELMDERGIDTILVHLWPNQYYLSGMYQHLPWYPVEVCEPQALKYFCFGEFSMPTRTIPMQTRKIPVSPMYEISSLSNT
jgi:hypothetical protein